MEKEKKVLVKGYMSQNLGDDLFIKILLERYPQIKFSLIAPTDYFVFSQFNNCKCVGTPLNMFNRILARLFRIISITYFYRYYRVLYSRFFKNQLRQNDAYLIIGGSMFKESAISELFIDIDRNIIKTLKNKPAFLLGANFGPYQSAYYYEAYYKILSNFNDICFRDEYSYSLFYKLGNVRLSKDIIFQYKIPKQEVTKNSMAFVVVDFSKHYGLKKYINQYEALIIQIAQIYEQLNYSITLFGFQSSELSYIKRIQKRLKAEICSPIKVKVYQGNIDDFLKSYFMCSTVFATRFHSMVLSFMAGQKVLPILYNMKMQNFLDDINYKGACIKLSHLSISRDEIVQFNDSEPVKMDYSESAQVHFEIFDKFCNRQI